MATEAQPGQRDAQTQRTRMEVMAALNIYSDPDTVRKTGIVCTIGITRDDFPQLIFISQDPSAALRRPFSS